MSTFSSADSTIKFEDGKSSGSSNLRANPFDSPLFPSKEGSVSRNFRKLFTSTLSSYKKFEPPSVCGANSNSVPPRRSPLPSPPRQRSGKLTTDDKLANVGKPASSTNHWNGWDSSRSFQANSRSKSKSPSDKRSSYKYRDRKRERGSDNRSRRRSRSISRDRDTKSGRDGSDDRWKEKERRGSSRDNSDDRYNNSRSRDSSGERYGGDKEGNRDFRNPNYNNRPFNNNNRNYYNNNRGGRGYFNKFQRGSRGGKFDGDNGRQNQYQSSRYNYNSQGKGDSGHYNGAQQQQHFRPNNFDKQSSNQRINAPENHSEDGYSYGSNMTPRTPMTPLPNMSCPPPSSYNSTSYPSSVGSYGHTPMSGYNLPPTPIYSSSHSNTPSYGTPQMTPNYALPPGPVYGHQTGPHHGIPNAAYHLHSNHLQGHPSYDHSSIQPVRKPSPPKSDPPKVDEHKQMIDELVKHVKTSGAFDKVRKLCQEAIEATDEYKKMFKQIDTSVKQMLKNATWTQNMKKIVMRDKMKAALLEGKFHNNLDTVVSDIANLKSDPRFRSICGDSMNQFLDQKEEKAKKEKQRIEDEEKEKERKAKEVLEKAEKERRRVEEIKERKILMNEKLQQAQQEQKKLEEEKRRKEQESVLKFNKEMAQEARNELSKLSWYMDFVHSGANPSLESAFKEDQDLRNGLIKLEVFSPKDKSGEEFRDDEEPNDESPEFESMNIVSPPRVTQVEIDALFNLEMKKELRRLASQPHTPASTTPTSIRKSRKNTQRKSSVQGPEPKILFTDESDFLKNEDDPRLKNSSLRYNSPRKEQSFTTETSFDLALPIENVVSKSEVAGELEPWSSNGQSEQFVLPESLILKMAHYKGLSDPTKFVNGNLSDFPEMEKLMKLNTSLKF